jgi:predicted HD superfamily hydrolase involved in NAD metabolism
MPELTEIKQELQARLSVHRYQHTESVVDTALRFTEAIKANLKYHSEITENFVRRVETAAWLHDCCKELKNEELLTLAEFYGIEIYDEDRQSPNTLHARVGAAWAEEEYEIADPYIINAVRDHTLGSIGMHNISKILYLADMLEPGRDAKSKSAELERLRNIILEEHDLDKALLEAMNSKIIYVIKKNQPLHPLSVVARNSLI